MNTPWGESDSVIRFKHNILYVTTPSHGGFMVPFNVARDLMSAAIFQYSFNGYGGHFEDYVCFEEDCEAYLVFYSFPETMDGTDLTQEDVLSAMRRLYPDLLNPKNYTKLDLNF